MIRVLKRIDKWLDEGSDGLWSTPYPDLFVSDIAKFKKMFNIHPYCKNPAQRRKGMLAVVAIIIFVKILLRKEFYLIRIINGIPYWDLSDFYDEAVGKSKLTAFWFYTIGSVGMSVLMISLLQTFFIGLKKKEAQLIDRICSWLMDVYICGLCGDICRPLALFYAREGSKIGNLAVEFIMLLVGISLVCVFSESVKSILSIYLSRPAFVLFAALKLHYAALFVMLGINEITHIEIFKNTDDILCLLVVWFTQLLLGFLEFVGIYGLIIKYIKKMLTIRTVVITPFILLPFALFYSWIRKFF